MNKKVSGLVFAFIFLALLAAPMVGTVMAGKGQEKLDFMAAVVGTYQPPGRSVAGGDHTLHLWDFPFVATGWADPPNPPLLLVIGGTPIPSNLLSYAAMMHVNENLKNDLVMTVVVEETISIWADEAHTVLRGTLELQCIGKTKPGNGVGTGSNFNGFGTGEFAGVKISGSSLPAEILGEVPTGQPPPAPETVPISKHTRVGTIMGWPT